MFITIFFALNSTKQRPKNHFHSTSYYTRVTIRLEVWSASFSFLSRSRIGNLACELKPALPKLLLERILRDQQVDSRTPEHVRDTRSLTSKCVGEIELLPAVILTFFNFARWAAPTLIRRDESC